MTYSLMTTIIEPTLPLAHRLRAPQNGSTTGSPYLILLHGVGAHRRPPWIE